MRSFSTAFIVLFASTVLSSCVSGNLQEIPKSSPTPSKVNAVSNAGSANASNTSANTSLFEVRNSNGNSNVKVLSNVAGPPPADIPTNAEPGSPRGKDRQRVDVNPSATPVPPTFSPAPENSMYAVTMDKGGAVFEIREFKSHPKLKRVEVTWVDQQNKIIRLIFRDGKVVESKVKNLPPLQTASAADLMKAAGKGSKVTP